MFPCKLHFEYIGTIFLLLVLAVVSSCVGYVDFHFQESDMGDASSFSSLLALVDNHLSKTSIRDENADKDASTAGIKIPSLMSTQYNSISDTAMSPAMRLPIPSFSLSDTPIKSVLAEQVANMLKAKEKRLKEEEQKNAEQLAETKQEHEGEGFIDLMQALRSGPIPPDPIQNNDDNYSISSSLESLLAPKFTNLDIAADCDPIASPEPLNLPCILDMSFVLNQNIKGGKCSNFGKVLISRYRPVAAPYFRARCPNSVQRFDFNIKSPCDIIKEKLRKPCTFNHNV